jgi:hypothetical protein
MLYILWVQDIEITYKFVIAESGSVLWTFLCYDEKPIGECTHCKGFIKVCLVYKHQIGYTVYEEQ